jgi:3',5'-cyclic AMP phosphodiesterase CpdA
MRLLAISDLHLGHPVNRDNLWRIGGSPEDWLILAGDIGETEPHLALAFEDLKRRFAKLIWVLGNHELWTVEQSATNLRGKARYEAFVALARRFGVIRPRTPVQNGRRGTGR